MNTDTAITMLLAMGVAAVVSFLSTPMVKSLAYKVGAIDVPKDNRRMHKVPIPRLGGLAIFLAFLLSVLVFANIDRQMQGILLGATMIVVLSLKAFSSGVIATSGRQTLSFCRKACGESAKTGNPGDRSRSSGFCTLIGKRAAAKKG